MNRNPKLFGHEFQLSWSDLATGGAFAAGGLLLLLFPGLTKTLVFLLLGVALLLVGVAFVVRYLMTERMAATDGNLLAKGLMWIAAGVLVICRRRPLAELMPPVFGLIILISGIYKLQRALGFREMGARGWIVELAVSIVCIALGIIVICSLNGLIRLVGAVLFFEGVYDLFSKLRFRKLRKRYIP